MTDKPNKSTKANQLEALNALIDKQTAQLADIATLMNSLKAMIDTVISIDSDKKCSCKDGGCSCKDTGCYCDVPDASDAPPEAKYSGYLTDLIEQWKGIQPRKSEKDCSECLAELHEKLKIETAMHEKHIDELNKMHHLDLVYMRKKYEELLDEAKRGCKCKCNDTECEDINDDDEGEEYGKVFMRFSLESNDAVTIDLSATKEYDGYTISCAIDCDDNSCSAKIVTNEIDEDLLEILCMKITNALQKFDVEPTANDLVKIATKLHQLFAELS